MKKILLLLLTIGFVSVNVFAADEKDAKDATATADPSATQNKTVDQMDISNDPNVKAKGQDLQNKHKDLKVKTLQSKEKKMSVNLKKQEMAFNKMQSSIADDKTQSQSMEKNKAVLTQAMQTAEAASQKELAELKKAQDDAALAESNKRKAAMAVYEAKMALLQAKITAKESRAAKMKTAMDAKQKEIQAIQQEEQKLGAATPAPSADGAAPAPATEEKK